MRQELIRYFQGVSAVTTTGAPIDARNLFAVSVSSVSTSTATGTLKLQFSNDYTDPTLQITAPVNWIDIPSATVSVTAASTVGIPKTDICYRYIRAVFTNSAGSGLITVNIMAQGA